MTPFKMIIDSPYEKWRAAWFWGKEPETIAWIERMPPGSLMWDIGANIGVYTLFAASRGVGVIAFEPSRINHKRLCENVALNEFVGVECLRLGLGSRAERKGFQEYNIIGESGHQLGIGDNCVVTTGDDLILKGYAQPDYIKLDVDGQEEDILRGCARVLYKGVRSVLVEVNDYFGIFGIMKSFGYREKPFMHQRLSDSTYIFER